MHLRLALCVVVSATAATASAANVLTNAGFETGDLTGWNVNNGDGAFDVTVGAPGIGAQEGDFALSLNAARADGVPEVNQGIFGIGEPIPASEGQDWNLSGYFLTESALPAGATFGLLKIVFEDADGNDLIPASASAGVINTEFPGVESQPFLNEASPVGEWIFTEAQGVAPAGTESVAFLLLNVDFGNGGNHPMWFDNITAQVIPEPAAALIAGFGLLAAATRRR